MKAKNPITLILIILVSSNLILSQTNDEDPWWPHPIWGAGDQVGASNWITPEKILESISLVKTGKVYDLGFEYKEDMVFMGNRVYDLEIISFGPMPEPYPLIGHTETLTASIGQISTQFDGLGHIGKRIEIDNLEKDVYYNGFEEHEINHINGLKKLGIENVKPIITRGIYIDIARYKGIPTLEDGYVVTIKDVIGALSLQKMDESSIKEGDAILFNFGWWRLNDEKEKYMSFSTCPGIDRTVVDWLIEKKVVLTGSDSFLEPPGKWDVHSELLMKNGIYNIEYMNFQPLEEDTVYQFLFVVTPLKLKGATGSPVRPIAIR